jgi:hypothetical protein
MPSRKSLPSSLFQREGSIGEVCDERYNFFPLWKREAVKKFKLGMEKPPLLSRGGKNSRRQNRREIQNYEAFPRVPPSDAGNLKITSEKQKASPFASAQVQFIAGNGESSAFFGGVNFSLPGTWKGFSIFHSLNFFTASGGGRGILRLFKKLTVTLF